MQTLPDFQEEFETWTEKKLHFYTIETFKHVGTDEYEYVCNKPINSPDAVRELFPEEIVTSVIETGGKITVRTKTSYFPHFSQKFIDPFNIGIGDIALTKPVNENVYLSTLAQFYALSFFLGMLSRYFPSIWISLGRT